MQKVEVMNELEGASRREKSSAVVEDSRRYRLSSTAVGPLIRYHRAVLKRLLWVIGVLLCAFLFVEISSWQDGKIFLNSAGPICLGIACAWTALKLFTSDISAIWLPIPWLLCSSSLFFGLGPLFYLFGPEETIAYADQLYPVGQYELFRTNQLNLIGLFTIISAFLVMSKLLKLDQPNWLLDNRPAFQSDDIAITKAVVILFLLVGIPLHYLLVLPYHFGLLGFVLPGSTVSLNQINILSLFLLGYLSARCGRIWSGLFYSFLILQIATTFAQFSKDSLILNMMLAGLGLYFGSRRHVVFALTLLAVFLFYVWVTPLVTYGRTIISSYYGENPQVPLSERISIVTEGIALQFNNELPDQQSIHHAWWLRLSYASSQSFAMALYDTGTPGYSFDNLYYYFIPRFLYPDKPIITDVAKDITQMASGHRNSSTGLTVFGDLYWHGGWAYVICGCIFIGVLFTCLSRVALRMLVSGDWLLLPCSAIGILLSLHIDGWFVQAYLGSLLIFLGYLFGFSWLRPWVQSVALSLQPPTGDKP